MERLEILVRQARDQTGNQQYTGTQGVRQREFVRYANDAQTRIFNKLLMERSTLFTKLAYIDVGADTAIYPLPEDVFLRHNIIKVDYSPNGDARLYSPLDMRTPRQEVTAPGYPDCYFLRDGSLVLSPIPMQSAAAGLRLNYQYLLPALDIRRAQIDSTDILVEDPDGDDFETYYLTLEEPTKGLLSAETIEDMVNGYVDFLCVVDEDGNQEAVDIRFVSYDSSTRVITCVADTNLLPLSGSYVVFGRNATTHSRLPAVCERYLVEYMALRIQMRDSNTEAVGTNSVLRMLEEEILDSISNLEEDLVSVSVLDFSMLNYDTDL